MIFNLSFRYSNTHHSIIPLFPPGRKSCGPKAKRGDAPDYRSQFLLVTGCAIGCDRFCNAHRFVALHTLPVIGSNQPWFEGIFGIKRFAVAAEALWRCFRGRAVMVTALTNRTVFIVKRIGQLVGFNFADHAGDNFTVRKFYRFVFIRQGLNDDCLRDICITVGPGYGIPLAKSPGGHLFFIIFVHNTDDLRFGNLVTIGTCCGSLRLLFLKRDMAADAGWLGLLGFVTPDTALIDIGPMHGLLQGNATAFFVALNGVTLLAIG